MNNYCEICLENPYECPNEIKGQCFKCKKKACFDCIQSCRGEDCLNYCCEKCKISCGQCDSVYCGCTLKLCTKHNFLICDHCYKNCEECGKRFCEYDDLYECNICKRDICKKDRTKIPSRLVSIIITRNGREINEYVRVNDYYCKNCLLIKKNKHFNF